MNLLAIASDLVRSRGRGAKNLFARRQPVKWVVFDSDDWGSQRIPSPRARQALVDAGILTGRSPYDDDTLETADDIAALLDVLSSVRGADGNPAVFSCYSNPANPDFEAIRANGFQHYVWEGMSQTQARNGDATEMKSAWQQGMSSGLLAPQYHGREHLQVEHWMAHLRSSSVVRKAFDWGVYSVPLAELPAPARGFRAANYFRSSSELPGLADIIRSGADCFEQEFGQRARIYCPTNNIFHPALYEAVRDARCDAVIRHPRNLQSNGSGGVRSVWGNRAVEDAGLQWFGRNAIFEPAQSFGVGHALSGIRSAFDWGVPAVISTHRANYVSGISAARRDHGLEALRDLLRRIASLWPDACFVPSTMLLHGKPPGA